MILCFQQNLGDEVLVGGPLTSQESRWGPRVHLVMGIIAFLDAQEGRMGGFRVPRECRVPTDPPGILRFGEENECFVCV